MKMCHTNDIKKGACWPCPMVDIKRWKVGKNALAQNRSSSFYSTVFLYDKGGTIQRAGCLVL